MGIEKWYMIKKIERFDQPATNDLINHRPCKKVNPNVNKREKKIETKTVEKSAPDFKDRKERQAPIFGKH